MGATTGARSTDRPRVVADMSVSLDGFVAGANDSVEQPLGDGGAVLHDWLLNGKTEYAGDLSPGHEGFFNLTGINHDVVDEWFGSTGALVVGRRMYDLVEGWDGTYPIPGVPLVVLTHDPPATAPSGETTFEFVTSGVEEAVERARAVTGDGNVGIGGASVIQQCLDEGLLDEIRIHLVPVLLGDGVRLFDRSSDRRIDLTQTRVVEGPGVTHLDYRVVGGQEHGGRRAMTDDTTDADTETTDADLTIRRTFDVPRERVFRAFTDPDELERWFAPGSLNPAVYTLEPEPDGELSVSFLDGEDRTDIEGTYVEVVENERIVHTWNYPGESESRLTVEFRDDDGGCELVLTHEYIGRYREYSAEENADLYEEGWSSALGKLDAELREGERTMTENTADETVIETNETSLIIRRTLDAPRERVWAAWTDPDELAKWYAPGDMTAEVHEWEPEAGGALSISMLDGNGSHDAEGTFTEVVENEQLVHTWTWTHVDDPVETRITVEFVPVGDATEVVMTHRGHPDAETTEENAGGWSGVFENLASVLEGS